MALPAPALTTGSQLNGNPEGLQDSPDTALCRMMGVEQDLIQLAEQDCHVVRVPEM